MNLYNVARYGDRVIGRDAYGSDTFMLQFEPMSFSKIDGVSILKRQISVAPTVTIPSRRCINIGGQVFITGHGAYDYWEGQVIRVTLILQGADGLADLTTIAAELAGTPPSTAYAALAFAKYLPDAEDSSRYPPQYQVFLSGTESAPADSLVKLNSVWYLIKESYISTSGLRVSLANAIDSPNFEDATSSRVYNPVTDTHTTTDTTMKIFRVKWSEHFRYLSKASEQYERGDQQVFTLKTVTPDPPDNFTLSDGTWKVVSSQDEGLTWSCHVRRT